MKGKSSEACSFQTSSSFYNTWEDSSPFPREMKNSKQELAT